MSFVFHTGAAATANVTFANSDWAWLLKELLKACGWEIQASSDGANVSNTPGNGNDQITSAAEMNTNNAWYVIKQPAISRGWGRKGGRQFIIRRGTGSTSWMIAYVPLDASEVAQAPTANGTTSAVPTFTTRHALVGTLPDTTAAFGSGGGGGTHRLLIGANNQAPYGFYLGAWDNTGAVNGGMFLFDPLEPDSVDADDEDPYVVCATNTNGWHYQGLASITVGPQAFYRKGLSGEGFFPIAAAFYATYRTQDQRAIPRDVGRDINSKRERTLAVWYLRSGINSSDLYAGVGVKGVSSLWRWKNGSYHTGTRLSEFVDDDRFVLQDVILPWDPSITPVYGA